MIRHIVSWKLKAEDAEGKAASSAIIAAVLEPLVALDGIASLTVRPNLVYPESNWDLVLVGDYDSLEALDAYLVHPDHVAAVTIVREHVAQRAAVDYEL